MRSSKLLSLTKRLTGKAVKALRPSKVKYVDSDVLANAVEHQMLGRQGSKLLQKELSGKTLSPRESQLLDRLTRVGEHVSNKYRGKIMGTVVKHGQYKGVYVHNALPDKLRKRVVAHERLHMVPIVGSSEIGAHGVETLTGLANKELSALGALPRFVLGRPGRAAVEGGLGLAGYNLLKKGKRGDRGQSNS